MESEALINLVNKLVGQIESRLKGINIIRHLWYDDIISNDFFFFKIVRHLKLVKVKWSMTWSQERLALKTCRKWTPYGSRGSEHIHFFYIL